MAIEPPRGRGKGPQDVDDQIADRRAAEGRAPAARRPPPKPVPRKPGVVLDSPGETAEEPVADPEPAKAPDLKPREAEQAERTRSRQKQQKQKQKGQRDRGGGDAPEDEAPGPAIPTTTPAHLVLDANYYRSQSARRMGFEQTPTVGDFITGLDSPSEGEALGALLPSARARAHPDLPETDLRPPDFLTPLEAMKDIWMQSRGRLSRRTQELLEGVDLEDMLDMLRALSENEALLKRPDARLARPLLDQLGDEPGPLLVGFADPRLTELWRLFLEGWEIWVPQREEGGDDEGVELFWEGEAEDDDGAPLEIVQSLTLVGQELILGTRLGPLEDTITFDGEAFYRLKTKRA